MKSLLIPYNPKLKKLAQKLRKESTLGEVLLWNQLKRKQLLGYDFHRQKPLGNYIVDFYCPELNLVIEIDGSTHDFKIDKDEQRQRELENYGLHFLRVSESDVLQNLEGVVQHLKNWIEQHGRPNTPRPFGAPLSRGE